MSTSWIEKRRRKRHKKLINQKAAHYVDGVLYIVGEPIDMEQMERFEAENDGYLDPVRIERFLDEIEADIAAHGTRGKVEKIIIARFTAGLLIRDGHITLDEIETWHYSHGPVSHGLTLIKLPSGRQLLVHINDEAYDGEWDFWVVDDNRSRTKGVQARSFAGISRND